MADNLIYRLKKGESGAVITATLKANGSAVNLTGFTAVRIIAKKRSGTAVLDQACTSAFDATGVVSYAFDGTTSNIAKGDYLLEFKATDASGDLHYFPKGEGDARNYGTLKVTDPLG